MPTIIHIGYHKSASTYLQSLFSELPVNYLFFAGENREILNATQSKDSFDSSFVRSWVSQHAAKTNKPYPATILSHEELSGHPHGYETVSGFTVAKNLKEAFPDAKILIIVRSQVDYFLSLYAFRVAIKGYETRSLEEFVQEEGERGLIQHLRYDELIACYQKLFGEPRVLVLPMELLKNNPEQFHTKLFNFIEVPRIDVQHLKPANESTRDLRILAVWRIVNSVFRPILNWLRSTFKGQKAQSRIDAFRFKFYAIRSSITRALPKRAKGSLSLNDNKPALMASLASEFDASNRILEGLIGYDLHDLNYPMLPD